VSGPGATALAPVPALRILRATRLCCLRCLRYFACILRVDWRRWPLHLVLQEGHSSSDHDDDQERDGQADQVCRSQRILSLRVTGAGLRGQDAGTPKVRRHTSRLEPVAVDPGDSDSEREIDARAVEFGGSLQCTSSDRNGERLLMTTSALIGLTDGESRVCGRQWRQESDGGGLPETVGR